MLDTRTYADKLADISKVMKTFENYINEFKLNIYRTIENESITVATTKAIDNLLRQVKTIVEEEIKQF